MNKHSNKTMSSTVSSSNLITTDALIVNSNSNLVSDDILLQLQEQFGDSKQIYILNSSNQSLISSNSYANSSNNQLGHQHQPIQYLVVDKDIDINVILQDPNIFTQPSLTPSTAIKNNSKTNSLSSVTPTSVNSTTLLDESVQRVQAPPPKRKKFDTDFYRNFENKKNSYQDAFLRYLAGEKQPTLEISSTNEQSNKKPRDNIGFSTRSNTFTTIPCATNSFATTTYSNGCTNDNLSQTFNSESSQNQNGIFQNFN
jgi:hypothetical protein